MGRHKKRQCLRGESNSRFTKRNVLLDDNGKREVPTVYGKIATNLCYAEVCVFTQSDICIANAPYPNHFPR